MSGGDESNGESWRKFVGKPEDVESRPVRDVMLHVDRMGTPVYLSPEMYTTGIYTIQLPPQMAAGVKDPASRKLLEKLDGSLIGSDPSLMVQRDVHGTRALVLWINRTALAHPMHEAQANGEHLQEMMQPCIKALEKKFDLPLHSYPFIHEGIAHDGNDTPVAILLATDAAHQEVLHTNILRYLGSERRKARAEAGQSEGQGF